MHGLCIRIESNDSHGCSKKIYLNYPLIISSAQDVVPLNLGEFLLVVFQLDDLEELRLVLRAENSARDLPQELLEHGRDGVDGEAVNVDEPSLLEEVGQFSDVQDLAGRAEHVLLERTLLVDLQKHDLKKPNE